MTSFEANTEKMLEIAQRLHDRNMLAAADGNFSFRIDTKTICITPRGVAKNRMERKSLATISLDGNVLSEKPSSEMLMHLEIYRQCPEANAIIHAHPPTAVAWTIAKPEMNELPNACMPEVILALGKVPIAEYARPGTQAMGDVLKPFLPDARVIILRRHGAISWGESLEEAYQGMERLEHAAQILKLAFELGGLTALPDEEVSYLKELRAKLGKQSR